MIRKYILPEWWDDEVATNPAGLAEGLAYISRHAGFDLGSLRDPLRAIAFRDGGPCKFKKSRDASEDQLRLVRSLATRVAHLASAATVEPCIPPPAAAAQVRAEILGRGQPWVGLSNLVDYCWSIGIPVVHLASFLKSRQPDGLALKVRGRPVIALCKNEKRSAWLLFILAHELGHIVLGHIPDDGAVLDVDVHANDRDEEEKAANDFAVELLTGRADTKFWADRWPNAVALAKTARELGREHQIDPGHVVLNYAHSMGPGFFAVGNAALKHLEKGDATGIVRRKLAERLDWSRLPEDSCEFLMRVSRSGDASDLPVG